MYDEHPIKLHFLEKPLISQFITVAHPEFPVGGGAKPPGGQHTILPKFPKNCMELRIFWAVGGVRRGRPWIRQ